MAKLNLADLNKTLFEGNSSWTAAETPITMMEDKKRKQLLGVAPPAGYKMPKKTALAAATVAGFDPAVDWRNRNGGNHVTSVKNQGGCGSCVSFCTVAVVESMASIEIGQLLDLSEADQHFCSNHGANCGGWWHTTAFDQIKIRGVSDEACFPYTSAFPGGDIWNANPTCSTCADRNSRAVKITSFSSITTTTAAKNYLTDTGPLAAIMEVYTDFFSYSNGVYRHTTGALEGLHCVTIIGYNEAEHCWICKNSWGTGWGTGGFFKIAYGECKIDEYEKVGARGIVLPSPPHQWYGFENLGGALTSRPNAVSWAKNRIDVVVRGLDSAVHHKWWNGTAWLGWENLGGLIQGAPAICSWAKGRLDVFAVGLNHHMWHKYYSNGWSSWKDIGGTFSSEPACVSWGKNRIDIFARGINGSLKHKWWDGAWHGWEDLGGVLIGAPAVSSWASGRLDVFARGMNSHLFHKWWNGTTWSAWEDLGNTIHGSPAAESWGANRIDVFYPGSNSNMYHKWWNGSTWSGEENLGGTLSSDVGVASWAVGRLDTFVMGTDSSMFHKWYV